MNPTVVIAALNAAVQVAKALQPLAAQAMAVASTADQAAIKVALADLQAQNDAIFSRVQDKLRAAAEQ